MVEIAPRMTVSGAAPATPKNTTDGTPSRLLASPRATMSGPAVVLRAMSDLSSTPARGERGPDGGLGVLHELDQVVRQRAHDPRHRLHAVALLLGAEEHVAGQSGRHNQCHEHPVGKVHRSPSTECL